MTGRELIEHLCSRNVDLDKEIIVFEDSNVIEPTYVVETQEECKDKRVANKLLLLTKEVR